IESFANEGSVGQINTLQVHAAIYANLSTLFTGPAVDPHLGPLAANPGFPATMAFTAASPVGILDQGASTSALAGITVPTVDERGVARLPGTDLGAVQGSVGITGVSTLASGLLPTGTMFDIIVTFSQPVLVTGTPQLSLLTSLIATGSTTA